MFNFLLWKNPNPITVLKFLIVYIVVWPICFIIPLHRWYLYTVALLRCSQLPELSSHEREFLSHDNSNLWRKVLIYAPYQCFYPVTWTICRVKRDSGSCVGERIHGILKAIKYVKSSINCQLRDWNVWIQVCIISMIALD